MGSLKKTVIIARMNGKLNSPIRNKNKETQVNLQSPIRSSAHSSREQSPIPVFEDKGIQTDKYINFTNVIKFVLAAIICGLTFSQVKDFGRLNEKESCSEKVFYEYQNLIADTIIQLARESALKYSKSISENTIVSLDCAWDHVYCNYD